MRVAMITTWNTRCGISEYSRHLVEALRRRDDVTVCVFGSKNYDEYKIGEDEAYVVPTFGVLPWNKYGDHTFDFQNVLDFAPDVIHIQYEVMLYNQEGLYKLLEEASLQGIPTVITYHDNCIPPNLPYNLFDLAYTHREDVGVGNGFVLPMGIENYRPVVKTFGLGRSRHDIIQPICERNGWDFQYSFGEHDWKSPREYYNWLRDSDLIVLWYDDTPAAGSSSALRDAMATRRPVIVNDVTWFKDFESYYPYRWYKVKDVNELDTTMEIVLSNHIINSYSWDSIANTIVNDYKELCKKETLTSQI